MPCKGAINKFALPVLFHMAKERSEPSGGTGIYLDSKGILERSQEIPLCVGSREMYKWAQREHQFRRLKWLE